MGALLLCVLPDARASSPASSPACVTSTSSSSLDPVAVNATFGPGTLIIPMDSCYNPDNPGNAGPMNNGGSCVAATTTHTCYNKYGGGDVRLPFGVLYLLAENNIPVSVVLNPTKVALTDADFSITPPTGATTATVTHLSPGTSGYTLDTTGINCGTNPVYYSGMPFVVEASFAAQALQVLTTFNAANTNLFQPVTFHVSNYSFSAPVLAVIASRPKPVLIDTTPLDTYLSETGVTSVAAANTVYLWLTGSGSSYSYTWPTVLGAAPAGCSGGTCTALLDSSSNRIVDVVWASNLLGNLNNWSTMGPFFQAGGTVLGLDDAVSFESGSGGKLNISPGVASKGAQKGSFCAEVVTTAANPLATAGPTSEYPPSNRFLQIDDIQLSIQGNSGGVDGASGWSVGATPAPKTEALSNGTGYSAIAGHPMVSGVQTAGDILYLASLNSWHGGSGNKDGGLHLLYNTLVAGTGGGAPPCTSSELTRSTPVAHSITLSNGSTSYANYLGSFDWTIPANAAALGNTLYQADPTKFPYMTGHFREYKAAGTYTGTPSNTPTCSPTDTTSPCNWDVATSLPIAANRKLFVVTGSAGSWTLSPLSAQTSPALSYVYSHLNTTDSSGTAIGVLGGIDWSTAAVIESRNVGGFTNRPTIAYVGARDGMIHAFCVAPASGASSCYGVSPGQEIWAIIPPGQATQMTTAYNGGTNMDWSKVNVGGDMRVADMTETFGGATSQVTRTVLLIGMHDTGYIDAIDITNPDPSALNVDGFRFLWENNGSLVASGVTAYAMGPTNGATLAQVSSSSGTGVAVVTSATCYGLTGCPNGVTAGYNTYALRLADGVAVSSEQRLYSLTSSLLGAPINNDAPAVPTALDTDGDGTDETIYVSTLEGKVRGYILVTQGQTAPTRAVFDKSTHPPTDLYNANTIGSCATGVACQPIGVSPTIVRKNTSGFDVLVATGGADWARAVTDKGDLTATKNLSYVTGFDASTLAQFPPTPFTLGGTQPPVSPAGGSSAGTAAATPLTLRAYAQLTVAGSDLYANVTSLSIGSMQQLLQPLMVPGAYGNILEWHNINSTAVAVGSILPSGSSYAGGAGAVSEADTAGTNGQIFIAGVTSSVIQALTTGSTSLRNTAYAVVQTPGGSRAYSTLSWFDVAN